MFAMQNYPSAQEVIESVLTEKAWNELSDTAQAFATAKFAQLSQLVEEQRSNVVQAERALRELLDSHPSQQQLMEVVASYRSAEDWDDDVDDRFEGNAFFSFYDPAKGLDEQELPGPIKVHANAELMNIAQHYDQKTLYALLNALETQWRNILADTTIGELMREAVQFMEREAVKQTEEFGGGDADEELIRRENEEEPDYTGRDGSPLDAIWEGKSNNKVTRPGGWGRRR